MSLIRLALLCCLCICGNTIVHAQKISSKICLSGEKAELTALGKWSFKLEDGSEAKTMVIDASKFNEVLTFNLVCPDGCDIEESLSIPYPIDGMDPLHAQVIPLSCFETNDGEIRLQPRQGIGPFTYEWSDGYTTQNRSNLKPGTYKVTVTDQLGCAVEESFEVPGPEELEADAVQIDAEDGKCKQSTTGKAHVHLKGLNNQEFNFRWNDGSELAQRDQLPAGKYQVTITDEKKCRIETFEIHEPSAIQPDLQTEQAYHGAEISCAKKKNGKVTLAITGGTPPYDIQWSESYRPMQANGDTTLSWEGLAPGNYQATITDANGCTSIASTSIRAPEPIELTGDLSDNGEYHITCRGEEDGHIRLHASGGTGQLRYQWIFKDSIISESPSLDQVPAGRYKVLVTDANGCTQQKAFRLRQPPKLALSKEILKRKKDEAVVKLKIRGGTGAYTLNGEPVQTTEKIRVPFGEEQHFVLTDEQGCEVEKTWSVHAPRKKPNRRFVKVKRKKSWCGKLVSCPTFGKKKNRKYRLY